MAFTDRLHNRGSISTGPYEIDNSLKFESDNSEYLSRTYSSTTNRRTWTVSAWVKRTELGSNQVIISGGDYLDVTGVTIMQFLANDTLNLYTHSNQLTTTRVFRDTSAWYHIVWAVDSTQSTAADRVNVYINGEQITDLTGSYPVLNWDSAFNYSAYESNIGRYSYERDRHFNGYMTDINFVDGSQLASTDFGEYDEDSAIWKPKAYTGSYGSQGFFLDFSDSSNLGDDASGNGNNFTENNITSADQATDTPTNNFCILNGLTQSWDPATSAYTTEGGTTYNGSYSNPEYALMASTFGVSRGKWYWEVKNSGTNGSFTGTGAMRYENPNYDTFISGTDGGIATYYTYGTAANKIYYFNGSAQTTVAYSSFPNAGTGEIISIALDMDNGKIYFAINNTWGNSGNPATGTNPVGLPSGFITDTYTPAASVGSSGTSTAYYNFGGYTEGTISSPASDENGYGTFEYAPPSGYYALCTKNLAEYG